MWRSCGLVTISFPADLLLMDVLVCRIRPCIRAIVRRVPVGYLKRMYGELVYSCFGVIKHCQSSRERVHRTSSSGNRPRRDGFREHFVKNRLLSNIHRLFTVSFIDCRIDVSCTIRWRNGLWIMALCGCCYYCHIGANLGAVRIDISLGCNVVLFAYVSTSGDQLSVVVVA